MKKTTILTTFIRELCYLIDKGETVSLSNLEEHILNKDVITWLKNKYPKSETNHFDLTFLLEYEYIKYIEDELESFASVYGIKTKFGTTNNGLCTIINMLTILLEENIVESKMFNN